MNNLTMNLRAALQLFLRSPVFLAHVNDHRSEIERQRGAILQRRKTGLAEQQRRKDDASVRLASLAKDYEAAQAKADKIREAINEERAEIMAAFSRSQGVEAAAYRDLRALEDPRIQEYRGQVYSLMVEVHNATTPGAISFDAANRVLEKLRQHLRELDGMFEADYGPDVGAALAERHNAIMKLVQPVDPHLARLLQLPDDVPTLAIV